MMATAMRSPATAIRALRKEGLPKDGTGNDAEDACGHHRAAGGSAARPVAGGQEADPQAGGRNRAKALPCPKTAEAA